MHHLVSNFRRALRTPSGIPSVTLLLLLAALAACEGDLDPRYVKGTSPGTGGSSLPGSGGVTGSGGVPASTGTGGTTQGGTGGMVSSACTYSQTPLMAKCGFNGCHSTNGTPPDLSSDAMASTAVGKAAALMCTGNAATALVNTTAPLSWVLFTRITSGSCGTGQMPLVGGPLSQTEIDCIKSYFMSKLQ